MELYYVKGKQIIGPLSIDELANIKLPGNTLVWHIGLKEWTSIDKLEYLSFNQDLSKSPPIPDFNYKSVESKTKYIKMAEESINIIKFSYKNVVSKLRRFSPKQMKFLQIWVIFHGLGLISSYLGIKGLSSGPNFDKFWPFVVFRECGQYGGGTRIGGGISPMRYRCDTYGLFPDYDIVEFLFYVIGAILVLLIINYKTK